MRVLVLQRERATVAAFKPDVPKEEDEEALKPVGTGDALGNIENVNEVRMSKRPASILIHLHHLHACYYAWWLIYSPHPFCTSSCVLLHPARIRWPRENR